MEFISQYILILYFVNIPELLFELIEVLLINNSSLETLLSIEIKGSRMVLDLIVKKRLSKGWLILLVVPISPEANNVDEDVLVELLPVSHRNLHAFVKNIRYISVHMNNGSIDCLGDLSAIVGRPALLGVSRKADLIVVYDMNDSSWTVVN